MNSISKTKLHIVELRLIAERMWIRLVSVLLAAGAIIASGSASAIPVSDIKRTTISDLTSGYSNCYFESTGSSYLVTMQFKQITDHLGSLFPERFNSRGIVLYFYDEDGNIIPNQSFSKSGVPGPGLYETAVLGEIRSVNAMAVPPLGWLHYHGGHDSFYIPNLIWQRGIAFLEPLSVKFRGIPDLSKIPPAIAIRAANITAMVDVARSDLWHTNVSGELILDNKMVYIRRGDPPGVCHIIPDPTHPPLLEARIEMTAPDWNLGELPQGERSIKPFSAPANQLCFTYDGPKLAGLPYAINATNQNGFASNGWYQLKHHSSPADAVPYQLVLQNTVTSAQVSLPNNGNVGSALANSGRECFIPTFTADTPKAAKEGDYSDVLSFTVVAKP